MKHFVILLSVIVLSSMSLIAQTGGIKGKVVDNITKEPLIGATVILNNSLKLGQSTDLNGNFIFKGLKKGEYSLRITYIGYDSLSMKVNVQSSIVDLKTIEIKESVLTLQVAEIKAEAIMAVQKGDTTQFNAAAFKTNIDANAEDMIKKLPGITVEDGKIETQGEEIKKIYINGKEAFNSDAKTALTNLQANAIENIQIFDDMSDQAKFTGFDDGNSEKAINIVTKQSFKDMTYGKVYGGIGADDNGKIRYNAGGDLTINQGSRTISVTALFNNVNIQNFSNQTMRGGGGGGGGGFTSDFYIGRSPGIVTTNAIGINYADKWGKKVDVTGSYFFYNKNNDLVQNVIQNYYPVESENTPARIYESYDTSFSKIYNHTFNFKLDWSINSQNKLIFRPKINVQTNMGNSHSFAKNSTGDQMVSSSDNKLNSWLEGYDFSGVLTYMHAFSKRGRSLSIEANGYYNWKNGNKKQLGETQTLQDLQYITNLINQNTSVYTNDNKIGTNVSYTEPIGKKGQMLVNYKFNYEWGKGDRSTYLYNDEFGMYDIIDSLQSSRSNKNYYIHAVGPGYKFNNDKIMLDASIDYQYSQLASDQMLPRPEMIRQNFNAILPNIRFTYKWSKTRNLRIFLRTSTSTPTVEQLQSVIDNSDPLKLSTGNPDLKQSYSGRFRLHYSSTNTDKSTMFFVMVGGNFTNSYIGNNTVYISRDTIINGTAIAAGRQLDISTNLNNYWRGMFIIDYALPIRAIKSNFSFGFNYFYTFTPAMYNSVMGGTNSNRLGLRLGLVSNISEKIDFSFFSNSSYNITTNSFGNNKSSNYFEQRLDLFVKWNIWKGLFVDTKAQYRIYAGLDNNKDNNYFLWDLGIAYKFLKSKQAEIKFSVNDILNQSKNINITYNGNYEQTSYTTVLQRYYLLTFTYKINAGKQPEESRPPFGGHRR